MKQLNQYSIQPQSCYSIQYLTVQVKAQPVFDNVPHYSDTRSEMTLCSEETHIILSTWCIMEITGKSFMEADSKKNSQK